MPDEQVIVRTTSEMHPWPARARRVRYGFVEVRSLPSSVASVTVRLECSWDGGQTFPECIEDTWHLRAEQGVVLGPFAAGPPTHVRTSMALH